MPVTSGWRTRSTIRRAWRPSTTRPAVTATRAAPARSQSRSRLAHCCRPLAGGRLHSARAPDRVRSRLQGSRGRRVRRQPLSLCSIENDHPFVPTCLPAERRAQRQSRMPARMRRHRRSRREASLTERARRYAPPSGTTATAPSFAGFPPRFFCLIIGGRSSPIEGEGSPWQRASDLPRKTVAVIERHHARDRASVFAWRFSLLLAPYEKDGGSADHLAGVITLEDCRYNPLAAVLDLQAD